MQATLVQSLGEEGSPGEGNGIPLQYSCLENLMDRRAWRATVHVTSKSWTQPKQQQEHHVRKERPAAARPPPQPWGPH